MQANVAHLPVVAPGDGTLVGYVGWKDLMRAREKVRGGDRDRASFLAPAIKRYREKK